MRTSEAVAKLRPAVQIDAPEQMLALTQRARRALMRWPLTELDPIEIAEFAADVREAGSFDDLAPGWQHLILESEAGAPEDPREFHLRLRGHA